MAGVRAFLAVFAVILFTKCLICTANSKLNVPRVLLPLFKDFSTNFTLEVTEQGCYKWYEHQGMPYLHSDDCAIWTTSRDDIIQLTPQNVDPILGCSSQVVVSAITKESKRNTVIVFAEEVHSNQIIPCDVIVDVIHSLQIITQTRELYVEEAPELFEVCAFDDQGNMFTTLQGVRMEWTLAQTSASGGISNVMRFMAFKDSPYETPPSVAHFDEVGIHGHIVLLEGIKTGSSKVSVQLPYAEYRHVSPIEVQLMVVANLIIDPADIYLLPGDHIKYRVLQVRHGRLREIELPSLQYFLEIENRSVATMEESSSIAQGGSVGCTTVSLRDLNVNPQEANVRVPTATIHVALPAFLHLNLLPHHHWSVLVGNQHTIAVEVYDRSNHKFHGDGMRIKVSVPKKYFSVEWSSVNGTLHMGTPREPGTARVEATLEGVVGLSGKQYSLPEKVTTQEDMIIYPPMTIHPPQVVVPWDPVSRSRYEVKLQCSVEGVSLIWSSSNSSVGVVTQSGLVRTVSSGSSEIVAAMLANPHNKAFANVLVLPPSHLQILGHDLEAEVGKPIYVNVAIFAQRSTSPDRLPFTKCDQLPLDVKLYDSNFDYDKALQATPKGNACTTVAVVASVIGTSKISVEYREGETVLVDSAVVAAYRPLTVVHPASAETVLSLGASRQLVFAGGPRRWTGQSVEHGQVISVDGTDIADVWATPDIVADSRDTYVYSVLCRSIGETTVTLTVFNDHGTGRRLESTAKVRVFCAKPRHAVLRAVLNTKDNSSCPMNVNAERVAVQSSQDLELELELSDAEGRVFDNITSVLMEWSASPSSLSYFVHKDSVFSETLKEKVFVLPYRHFQILHPLGSTGAVDVTVTLSSYRSSYLSAHRISADYPPFAITNDRGEVVSPDITATLSILLVSDTLVIPNKTTLFNHPSSRLLLQVSQGSGYFQPQLDSNDIVDVRYIERTRSLEVRARGTGTARLGLVDLCLPSRQATITVTVVGVQTISVDVTDRLQKGKRALCTVKITDTTGNPIELSDLSLLELRHEVEHGSPSVIEVLPYDKDSDVGHVVAGPGEFLFVVRGLSFGDASLTFVTGRKSYQVKSETLNIQVFDALRLSPRNLTVLVGSQILIEATGGPSPGSLLEFSMWPSGFAAVSSSGILEGEKVGQTRLTARAVGTSKLTGAKIVYSEDSVDVFVVPLSGVRIECPLTRLEVGAVMPVWVSGISVASSQPLSPLIIGSTQPALAFQWDSTSRDVAELSDVLQDTGIEVTDYHRVSMRVSALKPGSTTIRLAVPVSASMTPNGKPGILETTIQIEVYEGLRLTSPVAAAEKDFSGLLIAPDTQLQLRTNRDGVGKVRYSLQGVPGSSDVDRNIRDASTLLNPQSPVLSVSASGMVVTHSAPGHATIIASAVEDSHWKQSISINVDVKPVHYIMVSIKSPLVTSKPVVQALPRGLELRMDVTYHDNTGRAFAATKTNLSTRASRGDLIRISPRTKSPSTEAVSNASYSLTLLHSGQTVLRLFDPSLTTRSVDFVKLPIEELIFPTKAQVTVGDVICFALPLKTRFGDVGHWSSNNGQVLMIDEDTGIARALSPGGPVLVQYHLAGEFVSSTEIDVFPISSMVFISVPEEKIVNWIGSHSPTYQVPLVLNGVDEARHSNLVTHSSSVCKPTTTVSPPFNCEVRFNSPSVATQISDVFVVVPSFNSLTGLYACELISVGTPSAEVSRLQTNITLRARSGSVVTPPLVLPFLPSLYLNSHELTIPGGSSATLNIVGVPEVLSNVRIIPDDKDMVTVSSPAFQSETTLSCEVSLSSKFWSQATINEQHSVTVVSSLTNQTEKVLLKLRLEAEHYTTPLGGASILDIFYTHRHTLIVSASCAIIVLVTLYIYATFIHPAMRAQDRLVFQQGVLQRSPGIQSYFSQSNLSHTSSSLNQSPLLNRSTAFCDTEPVYGDPQPYYSSPARRRLGN